MVARYKKSLEQLTMMLHIIKTQKKLSTGAIVDFQLLLLKKIKEAEKSIIRTKGIIQNLRLEKANDRPTKERSKEIASLISKFEEKIESYRYIIYIWKMYGDSIAFHFCDKYSIKHFLYNENYHVKETAGFISGKEGIKSEIMLLKKAAQKNVPAVLCDLTNTLRHGDVCLLGHNDPYPIEVKTSGKLNKRGEKQLRNIDELNSFLIKDEADNFRGVGPVLRREHIGKEQYHLHAINDCISKSYEEGISHVSPERGIHYLAITKLKKNIFDQIPGKYIHMLNLNDYKREMNWHPYTPFQLSLNPEHIYNFTNGNLIILVLLDLQVIKRRFKRNGLHITFLQDEHWYAQVSATGNILDGGLRVSTQSFLRIAFEFQSLTWAIKQHKKQLNLLMEGTYKSGRKMEIPPDWIAATDPIPM
ncbi:hypothetical protein [Klebsiella quasipneumoniae]|uniref:hypothetical protein n=1 Tax=Klebsiella quasipneumoniae TaxID=1463165 RepID=UPI0008E326C0|nr:hypothetical protein [Klebsiella quasipneumoniae]SFH49301.1 hypothetical protein SAMN03159418_04276 [Klebsiella quasipneumoniae]SFY26704.1 hypothetical protein SAMN03159364_05064 [Klebsiella quasipneumoniae]SFY37927.1 hypothetical protein SAMN03159289_04591 [Klebsiella quasipneumoniae]SMD17961.1 hypothetical protein SAMN03159480_10980 [Klebsiella quasipneumoniae]